MRQTHLSHEFVEFIPERLDEGVLYISRRYGTAAHKCCCGCGGEVITPLTPTDWSLRLEGGYVTLYPSIGNWSFSCRSHYWISRSKVVWAGEMSQRQIERGRATDHATKKAHFEMVNRKKGMHAQPLQNQDSVQATPPGLLSNLWRLIKRWVGY